jgi:hypothetical protein
MKYFILKLLMLTSTSPNLIFDFNKESNINTWMIVNDGVMGGRSKGTFQLNNQGHAIFEGTISLENNGGFSSVRHNFEKKSTKNFTKIKLKIKGDGKKYQLRIKSSSRDYFSYISHFSTSGEWQEIEIELKDMYPSFRGRKLDRTNYPNNYIEEIGFLFGNKSEEKFKLLIDKIELK